MIIKVMFHIPMKLKFELARASMTTSDVNNQWRSNFKMALNENDSRAMVMSRFTVNKKK
jgi:hypothetical protein